MELHITCIPGDGIGPEIVAEAKKVLEKVADKYGHEMIFTDPAKNTSEALKNEEIEETDKNFSIAPHNTIIKNGKISQNININGVIETTKENDLIDNDTSSKRGEIKNIINIYNKNNKIDNKNNKASY